jgi:hypothetical protein
VPRAWQTLAGVLVAVGIPAAAAAWWRHLVGQHPVAALWLAGAWVLIVGAVAMARKAAAGPAERRLAQAGNALDRAAGSWLSSYRRRYRRWVLDSRRYVDIKGLATAGDNTPQLEQVYVDVALTRRAPHQVSSDPLSKIPEDVTERYSIGTFLDHDQAVVLAVLGPPGCGKTTLLAHIAMRSARSPRRSGRGVPILLALRDHAQTIAGSPEIALPTVLRSTLSSLPASEPDGWWERHLQRGHCVVLLDGLDEVARPQDRQAVTNWVDQQIASYPRNHFVITSRPHGYRSAAIGAANVLVIRPFTSEQVEQFLHGWYLATELKAMSAGERKGEIRAVRLRADEAASDLLGRLRAAPALHDLTVNPLLLTMIANVHRFRGALPGSRADLYREICQVMLSRRLQSKGLPEQLPWPVKEKLLTRLAYEMMNRQVRDLPRDQILAILRPGLRRMPQEVTGQAFLDDVSFNGLLVERESGDYAFAHLTFQEYLAAQHIRDNGLARTLISVVGDEWWRETILLYAATADTDPIVSACLDRATIPALALAFECTDTGHELAPELRQRLSDVQAAAFRPDCDPAHRRLIAAVLTTRLARQVITTSAGARLCTRPVPVSLYWLFLQDTQAPAPDGCCDPELDPTGPATGIWGSEARAFLTWVNAITADQASPGSAPASFRLPTAEELDEQVGAGALDLNQESSVTSLWAYQSQGATALRIWPIPGRPDPHLVSGGMLEQALAADATDTPLALQLFTSAMRTLASDLCQAIVLDLGMALDRSPDRDIASPRGLDFALALAPALAHALDVDRNLDVDRELDIDRDRARNLARNLVGDLARARDLARAGDSSRDIALARVLARVRGLDLALTRALGLALGLDRDLALALDLPYTPYRDLDLALDGALHRALDRDRDFDFDPDRDLARALDRALDRDFARVLDHVGGFGGADFALRTRQLFLDTPLGRILGSALAKNSISGFDNKNFAIDLMTMAGVSGSARINVDLDGSLSTMVQDACATYDSDSSGDSKWDPAKVAARLAKAAEPLLDQHCLPRRSAVAGIRIAALMLAGSPADAADSDALRTFRALAAAVTLMEQRAAAQATTGESIVLASS